MQNHDETTAKHPMNTQTAITSISCDDAEQYCEMFSGWSHTMTQLSGGRFGYEGNTIQLPEMLIYLDSHKRAIRWSEFTHIPVTTLFIPVRSAGPIRWRGIELEENGAVLQNSGMEHHFTAMPHTCLIYIDLDTQLVEKLGWNLPNNSSSHLSSSHRDKLVDFCMNLPSAQISKSAPEQAILVRNEILRLMSNALFASGSELNQKVRKEPAAEFNILLQTEGVLKNADFKKPVAIGELVEQLGITERSLFRTFERQLGIAPSRYIEILRLKALRKCLMSPSAASANITDTAHAFGFSNSGRMARRYCEMFHEYPKESVARTKLAISNRFNASYS